MRNVFMYSDELARLEYNPSHPFKPARAKLMHDFLNRYDLLSGEDRKVVNPVVMDEELLYLFHTRDYIDLLRKGDERRVSVETFRAGLGTPDNPIFSGMYRYALSASSATFEAAMMLCRGEGRFAFNPFGGFHHAGRDHAEGFCYINDVAIAITELVNRGRRVAYIDTDVHHGNGVQDAFYGTDKVLKISLHETGKTLYPGYGFEYETGTGAGLGYNINIPLLAGTDDEVYLLAFETLVPPLVRSFGPDIVVTCIGGDTHKEDPLAHFNLTSNGYERVIALINGLAPKLLALGSGGYNPHKTAALWTLAWAEFSGCKPQELREALAREMMGRPKQKAGRPDDLQPAVTEQQKEESLAQALRVIKFIRDNVFPSHGLKG